MSWGALIWSPGTLAVRENPTVAELGLATWPREETRIRGIEALSAHTIMIRRPIITAADDRTAVVGRSPESVRSVLP